MINAEEHCAEQLMGTGPFSTLAGVLEPAVLPAKKLLLEAEQSLKKLFCNLMAANLVKPLR